MLLTEDQKLIFARWLETQIFSSEGIQQQFDKIGVPDALKHKERTEQMACKIVLNMITSGQSMSLSGGNVDADLSA